MSSKKHRKKLKAITNEKKPLKMYLIDSEQVISYLKKRPYEIVKRQEILDDTNLHNKSLSAVSQIIKAINHYTNEHIITIKGKNGGYMYYEQQ